MVCRQQSTVGFILLFLLTFVSLVRSQSITVLSPNGGEYWAIGPYHSISWSSEGVGYVHVQISRDGGSSWDTIGWEPSVWDTNYYTWRTTGDTSSNCLIKVSDGSNPSTYDISDSTFIIGYDTIRIISPNGGEVFLGGTGPITWLSDEEEVPYVNIYVSRDGGSSWEESVGWPLVNTGIYRGGVGGDPSTKYMVKVVDIGHVSEPYDTSDSTFTIVRRIRVITPTGSEYRYPGESFIICWITSGLGGNVRIAYSTTGGSPWTIITPSTPEDTSYYSYYEWDSIPDMPTTNLKITVTHLSYREYFVNSHTSYWGLTILRRIQVEAPRTGDTLYTNMPYDIKWRPSGVPGKVKIDYYNGTFWDTVTSSTQDDGSFTWAVPNTPTNNAKIRIAHLRYYNNIATSDTFVIAESPTITGLPYCYPNPFSPTTDIKATIKYMIEKDARVTIKIYDVGSNLVNTLIKDVPKLAGVYYAQDWDGTNSKGEQVSNGVYFCVIKTDRGEKRWLKIAVLQ